MKKLIILLIWIAVGTIVAGAGVVAWRLWQKDDPEATEQVTEQVRDSVEAGKEAFKTVSASIKKHATEPKQEADPKLAEAPKATPKAKPTLDDRERDASDRLNRLVTSDPELAAADAEYTAATETDEETRKRQEDALFQRQMRIYEELTE